MPSKPKMRNCKLCGKECWGFTCWKCYSRRPYASVSRWRNKLRVRGKN